jgi:hypothetical protein
MVRLPRGGHRTQGCGAIFARYGGLPSDSWRTARPPRLSCRPKKTWQPKHPRGMAIPFRYVTENRVCQQVANPPASTPSATPNDKLNIAPADRPNNPHPRSVTGGRRTDGPELSVGTTLSPSWSRCKPSMQPGMTRCPTACAIVLPRRPFRPLSVSTSMRSRQSCHHEATDAIELQRNQGRPR